jgi:hypothetical protein
MYVYMSLLLTKIPDVILQGTLFVMGVVVIVRARPISSAQKHVYVFGA